MESWRRELQLRWSHLKVDGLCDWMIFFLKIALIWWKAQFSYELWHGCQRHPCPGIPLLVKDSLSSPECVKRHLIQTFNERSEDTHILNFNLGCKIVKSNKNSFLCTWLRIAGPFPSLLKTLASGRVSVTSYRTALDQIWNLLASFLPNHCSALPKHILLNSGYIRAVTFCANPTWPIYAVHFFSKSI